MTDQTTAFPAVIALDLATTVGWAVGTAAAVDAWPIRDIVQTGPTDGVTCGSRYFGGAGRGALFFTFARWFDDMVDQHGPGLVAVEQPVHARTMDAARISMGLAALVDLMCHHRSIQVIGWAPASVKKHFVGNGQAKKAAIEARCRARGWTFPDNNAADALAVLDMAAHMLRLPPEMRDKKRAARKPKVAAATKVPAPRRRRAAA